MPPTGSNHSFGREERKKSGRMTSSLVMSAWTLMMVAGVTGIWTALVGGVVYLVRG